MQRFPGFDDRRFRSGILLKGIHRREQPLERFTQFVRARVALSPSDTHARLLESLKILCPARKLLELPEPGDVFAQKLRAKKTLFVACEIFQVLN